MEKSVINRVVKRARAVLRVISFCYVRIRHNAPYIALRGVAGFRVTGHCLAYTARCASKARMYTIYAKARHQSGFVLPPISIVRFSRVGGARREITI